MANSFLMKRLDAKIPHNGDEVLAPCFVVIDERGLERVGKIKHGAIAKVQIRLQRNPDFNRKYHALIGVVYQTLPDDMAERYPTLEKFKGAIKIALGVTEEFVRPGGATELMPGSIAFNKMDEIEFAEFYDSAVALICSRIIPGIDSESLKHEVLDLIGG